MGVEELYDFLEEEELGHSVGDLGGCMSVFFALVVRG
jgi:hypothetical protein